MIEILVEFLLVVRLSSPTKLMWQIKLNLGVIVEPLWIITYFQFMGILNELLSILIAVLDYLLLVTFESLFIESIIKIIAHVCSLFFPRLLKAFPIKIKLENSWHIKLVI